MRRWLVLRLLTGLRLYVRRVAGKLDIADKPSRGVAVGPAPETAAKTGRLWPFLWQG